MSIPPGSVLEDFLNSSYLFLAQWISWEVPHASRYFFNKKRFFPFSMSLPYIPRVETRLCNMDDHMFSMSSKSEIALIHCKPFVAAAAFKFGCTDCSLNSCETASNQHFNKTHDLLADSLAKRKLLKELNRLQKSLSEDDLANSNKMAFMCKSSRKSFLNGQLQQKNDYRRLLISCIRAALYVHRVEAVSWEDRHQKKVSVLITGPSLSHEDGCAVLQHSFVQGLQVSSIHL